MLWCFHASYSTDTVCSSHAHAHAHVHGHSDACVHAHAHPAPTPAANGALNSTENNKKQKDSTHKHAAAGTGAAPTAGAQVNPSNTQGSKPGKSGKGGAPSYELKQGKVPTPFTVLFREEEAKLARSEAEMRGIELDPNDENTIPVRIPLLSRMLVPTLHEVPADATTKSHQLLLKAGYIRQLSSGHYTMLPLGMRVLRKIEAIVDEEMQRAGSQRIDLPIMMSRQLWEATGRWESTGSELFRLKDRNGNEFCVGPTHEEAITALVAAEVTSYKQLPLRLHQIGRKFRDEGRPRGGLLRAREFVMKDMYSFDIDHDAAHETYKEVLEAYRRVFKRMQLPAVQVEADSGNIGGSLSHEYHVISPVGEDTLLQCGLCAYTANQEKCAFVPNPEFDHAEHERKLRKGPTTEAMRRDPRSYRLWPTPEEEAKLAEKAQGDPEKLAALRKVDADVRANVASIIKKLIPSMARQDVPCVANLVKLKFSNAKDSKGMRMTAAGLASSEQEFGNHVLIFVRADRELNDRAIMSYFGAQDVEFVGADMAALMILRYYRFKMNQHAALKASGKLPPNHNNPFERRATSWHTLDLNKLARLEDGDDDAALKAELRELDKRNARENVDGGLVIMVDSSLIPYGVDVDEEMFEGQDPMKPLDMPSNMDPHSLDAATSSSSQAAMSATAEYLNDEKRRKERLQTLTSDDAQVDNSTSVNTEASEEEEIIPISEIKNQDPDDVYVDPSTLNEWERAMLDEVQDRHKLDSLDLDSDSEQEGASEDLYTAVSPLQADFSLPKAGDRCVQRACDSQGILTTKRGIEVGHVFYLGTKYSAPLKAFFHDANDRSKTIEMGCYGIGVSRLLSAAIESEGGHDEHGIIWSEPIAPYVVYITAIGKPGAKPQKSAVESKSKKPNAKKDPASDLPPLEPEVFVGEIPESMKNPRYEDEDDHDYDLGIRGPETVGDVLRKVAEDNPLGKKKKSKFTLPESVRLSPFAQNSDAKKASEYEAEQASSEARKRPPLPTSATFMRDIERQAIEKARDAELAEMVHLARNPALLADMNWSPDLDNPTHAENLAALLMSNVDWLKNDVILDDRHHLSPGARMKDANLCGFPWIIIVGKEMQLSGRVEVQHRRTRMSQLMTIPQLLQFFAGLTPQEERAEYDPEKAAKEARRKLEREELKKMGFSSSEIDAFDPSNLHIDTSEGAVEFDYARDRIGELIPDDDEELDEIMDEAEDDDMDGGTQPGVHDATKYLARESKYASSSEGQRLAAPLHERLAKLADTTEQGPLTLNPDGTQQDSEAVAQAPLDLSEITASKTTQSSKPEDAAQQARNKQTPAELRRMVQEQLKQSQQEDALLDQNESLWLTKLRMYRGGPSAPPLYMDDLGEYFDKGILRENKAGFIEFVDEAVDSKQHPFYAAFMEGLKAGETRTDAAANAVHRVKAMRFDTSSNTTRVQSQPQPGRPRTAIFAKLDEEKRKLEQELEKMKQKRSRIALSAVAPPKNALEDSEEFLRKEAEAAAERLQRRLEQRRKEHSIGSTTNEPRTLTELALQQEEERLKREAQIGGRSVESSPRYKVLSDFAAWEALKKERKAALQREIRQLERETEDL